MNKEVIINGIWYSLDIDCQEAKVIKSQSEEYMGKIIIPYSFFYEGITYTVTIIGEQAFRLCSRLNSITIPDGVIKVESKAFEGCGELTEVHINSIESWCNIEFCGLYSNPLANSYERFHERYTPNLCIEGAVVTELIIPSTVTTIKNSAFMCYEGLTSVIILDGVTSIGDYAFYGCCQLKSIVIPDSVTEIKNGTFYSCHQLKKITIPDSVTTIGEGAFENSINLTTIDISNGVTSIGKRAFYGCNNLISIIGGNNLKCICNSAFEGCVSLSSFDVFNNVEIIGNDAFYGCHNLRVVLPQNLVSLGRNAFYKCWLDSISIPKSLTNIDACAFKGCHYDCESLKIVVEEGNPRYDSRENCNAIIETKSNTLIIGCSTTNIPDGITNIGDEAFRDWNNLYSINIPNGVKSIGKYAFQNCYKLHSVTIPKSITNINGKAFDGCCHLQDIFIDSLESWCKIDFTGGTFHRWREYPTTEFLHIKGELCSKLKIPTSITEIKNHAFEGFYFDSVVIPPSITNIGDYAFFYTCGFKSITIPNSVKSIGKGAFCDCDLNFVVLPKSVEYIEQGAFGSCDNMTYITILGSPVIMDGAFRKCGSLRDLYCYGEDIPKVHNSFEGLDLSVVTLHVRTDMIEEIQNTEPWCKFGNIVPLKL